LHNPKILEEWTKTDISELQDDGKEDDNAGRDDDKTESAPSSTSTTSSSGAVEGGDFFKLEGALELFGQHLVRLYHEHEAPS
jgi:hypothetical protein